jgi:superfamily II DNA/RNA helicase
MRGCKAFGCRFGEWEIGEVFDGGFEIEVLDLFDALSEPTAKGLAASHFKTLTDIQSRAINHAFKGRDILGAVP